MGNHKTFRQLEKETGNNSEERPRLHFLHHPDRRIQWRNLKYVKGAPLWSAVYYYFDKWSKDRILKRMNLCLNLLERLSVGRMPFPSLGLVDSQSVKLAPAIFEDRSRDAFKKVNGRKRHILTDVLCRAWRCTVGPANEHDGAAGTRLKAAQNDAPLGLVLKRGVALRHLTLPSLYSINSVIRSYSLRL